MEDNFTSVQWESKNSVTDFFPSQRENDNDDNNNNDDDNDNNNGDGNALNNINGNGDENDNENGNSDLQIDDIAATSSMNGVPDTNSNIAYDDNDLEGSGLITQTMILGAQQDNKPINNEPGINYTAENQDEESSNIDKEIKISEKNEDITTDDIPNPSISNSNQISNSEVKMNSNSNNTSNNNMKYELEVTVTDPITEHEGSNSFTIYHIKIKTDNPRLTKNEYTIVRRYSDFDILHQCLSFDYPSLLIPPLPNKQRLEYIKGGRFTEEFVAKRCNSLNIFINRVIQHPILSKSEVLLIFFEDSDYWNTYKINLNFNESNMTNHSSSSVNIEGFTDFLMNSFKKPHVESKFNQNFKEIDHQRLKLQENLNKIDKIYSKVVNKQESIAKDLNVFGDEFSKLTILLNNDFNGKFREEDQLDDQTKGIVDQFKGFSENLKKSGNYYNDLDNFIEFNYLNNLKDLEHYLISLGNLIKLKDYKILDYEMLNNYLEKTISERDNLVNGGSLTATTEGTISYLSRKFESLTGLRGSSILSMTGTTGTAGGNINTVDRPSMAVTDADQSISNTSVLVNERIEKLNSRISLLEKEKVNAKNIYEKFEQDLIGEWNQFQKIKDHEISSSLNNLSNEYMQLYMNSNRDWRSLNIDVESVKMPNKLDEETRDTYFGNSQVAKNDQEIKSLLKDMDDI